MTDIDAAAERLTETCIECGLIWDDHRVADFRAHWAATRSGFDIPFTPMDGSVQVDMPPIFDGIEVYAATARTTGQARMAGIPAVLPVLIFQFVNSAHPQDSVRVGVAMGGEQMRSLRLIMSQSIDAAMKGARRLR